MDLMAGWGKVDKHDSASEKQQRKVIANPCHPKLKKVRGKR